MPEPFKNHFNKKLIQKMASHFKSVFPDFKEDDFVKTACHKLENLELKARSEQITSSLIKFMPSDYNLAGKIILESLGTPLDEKISSKEFDEVGISGWAIMPLSHYVGMCGHDHFEFSMRLLKEMTKRFTAEFAIRFFLIKSPTKTLKILKKWATDKDHHVRRLASEGCRPRLPWAMTLPAFIENPKPILEILEILKDDESEYVRRSVANNLNDISKDHPDLVVSIASEWIRVASPQRKRLVKHACRSLIKEGDKKVLAVFGYKPPRLKFSKVSILTPEVQFGSSLEFEIALTSCAKKKQPLIIDYIIHHQKSNGKTSPKVYKWKNMCLPIDEVVTLSKNHKMKKITTRVYYPGVHFLEVVINGVSLDQVKFHLKM